MDSNLMQGVKKILRSPIVIMAEIACITMAGIVGATFPQATPGNPALTWLQGKAPLVAELGRTLHLDRIFIQSWFLLALFLASLSLLTVIADQIRTLRRTWPGRGLNAAGAPVLHIGLLLVIGAGFVRVLWSAEAAVDLLEGETLPPSSAGWSIQRTGALATPIRTTQPIVLTALDTRLYPSGDLAHLTAHLLLSTNETLAGNTARIPVNDSIGVSGIRLFIGTDYGPAVLTEWQGGTTRTQRAATLLRRVDHNRFEATFAGPSGEQAHLRAELQPQGQRPEVFELRIMKEAGLLFAGVVSRGERIPLSNGGTIFIAGTPFWIRLHASRDPSVWLVYSGLACAVAGFILIYAFSMRTPIVLLFLSCIAGGVTGCGPVSPVEARRLVERYNAAVSEAYRRGDVRLVDNIVGAAEGRKLAGLIGVRTDMGITLDPTLLSLDIVEVKGKGRLLHIMTREHWRYRDRRIGSGEVVGKESEDRYLMRYEFLRTNDLWMVERIDFAAPPEIGRKEGLWFTPRGADDTLHQPRMLQEHHVP